MDSEFYFNLKKAAIFPAIKWERSLIFRFSKLKRKLFFALFLFLFSAFIYGFLTENFSPILNRRLFGFSIIFFALSVVCWLKESFLNTKLKKPKLKVDIKEAASYPEKYNLADFLSFEVGKAVFRSIKFAQAKKISQIDSSIFLYFVLRENPKLNFVFSRALLNKKGVEKILLESFKTIKSKESKEIFSDNSPRGKIRYEKSFQESILEALKIAQKKGQKDEAKLQRRIEVGDVLCALSKHDLIFKKILSNSNLKLKDIENLIWWLEKLEEKIEERKRFWEWKNLIKKGSLAKEWMAGYTITLDRFSFDISEMVRKQGFPEIIGHEKEISAMERVLGRKEKNNVLIVGESGSGRKSMIYALAEKSALGESLPQINYKRVIQLDLSTLLAQIQDVERVESILDQIFREVVLAGNVILFIDEFHNFVGRVPRPGTIDISGIISPYLSLPQFQIVAITNFEGFHRYVEQNSSLMALFEKVEVAEISEKETLLLLEKLTLKLEEQYKIFVSYSALRDIINYCTKYIPALPFPEKAMGILDEVAVYVAQEKEKIILPKHIAKIVSEKTQIPVGEIEAKEREILLNLENLIHERIINQDEAVNEVSAALKRARAEVVIRKGPMGCFLFLGPTGVGKTETSKALAEIYFGSEDRMIRLDMSEFQNVNDIPRLISSPGEEGLLTTPVRKTPFALILLDEFEKAHPNILNLFLQVFDEGHLTDGLGRKVDFKSTIIIATSNAGYQIILKALKEKTEWLKVKEKLLDFIFEKGIFRPELINRFDATVIFRPLTKENLLDIAELMLQKVKKNLAQKEVDFIITEPLKEKIVELGYDITFGARSMQRVIQDKVGNALAQGILSGQLKKGNRVKIDPQGFKLKINP